MSRAGKGRKRKFHLRRNTTPCERRSSAYTRTGRAMFFTLCSPRSRNSDRDEQGGERAEAEIPFAPEHHAVRAQVERVHPHRARDVLHLVLAAVAEFRSG